MSAAGDVVPTRSRVLDPVWCGRAGIYGGRVIAELAGVADAFNDQELLTLMVDFSGAVQPGEVEVRVTPQHVGGRSTSLSLGLTQGFERARAQAKLGRVEGRVLGSQLAMPRVLSPALTDAYLPEYWRSLPHAALMELRLVGHEQRGPETVTDLWLRLDNDRPEVAGLSHAARVACLVDAVPPALFFATPEPAFVPTLDLTLHLRPGVAMTDDGWCLARGRLVWTSQDFCAEEVTLWSGAGELLATATQNRRVVWA